MEEHKKNYSLKNDLISDYHEYSDGVHKGTGYSQELADQAYQQAKHEDKDHIHYTVEPDKWDSFLWNNDGDKIDRSSNEDSSSDSSDNSDGGCFITTACVKAKGLNDDCPELMLLRHFRDDFIAGLPDGENEINNYYNVAPDIVKKINMFNYSTSIWEQVYEKIVVCISLIKQGKNHEALNYYKQTVIALDAL